MDYLKSISDGVSTLDSEANSYLLTNYTNRGLLTQ